MSVFELGRGRCRSSEDGDCDWKECPQLRDGEPAATGRHCPLDLAAREDDDEPAVTLNDRQRALLLRICDSAERASDPRCVARIRGRGEHATADVLVEKGLALKMPRIWFGGPEGLAPTQAGEDLARQIREATS